MALLLTMLLSETIVTNEQTVSSEDVPSIIDEVGTEQKIEKLHVEHTVESNSQYITLLGNMDGTMWK